MTAAPLRSIRPRQWDCGTAVSRFLDPEVSGEVAQVNAKHPLVSRLESGDHFDDLAHILFDQAVLAEGSHLEHPAAYVGRVTAILVG
jgi:HSP90 family molecular chaperone